MPQNHLSGETSPYLLQHADNPVAWYPWGPDALERAQRENKPILLSIGYSACHWCHVMAHESFEDEATAELMNRLFINIKVDREERPDLDKIYQLAHSAITQRSGGWPLTMFLTPDQTPFFGGTYFPDEPRHNMPAFRDVLQRVTDYLEKHPDDIQRQNASMIELFRSLETRNQAGNLSPEFRWLDIAADELKQHFDAQHGGFGSAPKFPHPTNLELALRLHTGKNDPAILHIARFTLEQMIIHGVYDQLGGGFFRYSVDKAWMIPHFEKMLYDNGQLLSILSQAWQATHAPLFQTTITDTINWALRDMSAPAGGFYATLDADSEGGEGKYYIWSPAMAESLLDEQEFAVFASVYGLDCPANFEGAWHLHTFRTPNEAAAESELNITVVDELLSSARAKLLARREQRIRPGRDEKILTAWNALMIKGLALAGNTFNNKEWIIAAERALDFIYGNLWDGAQLFAVNKDRQARFPAYLDDHAFLLDAILELLQARWRQKDIEFAQQLADSLIARFEDKERGGFYFTADNHEALIYRPKPHADEALPAGGAIAAFALQRLGHLLGETAYIDAAERALQVSLYELQQSPLAHASFLKVLDEQLQAPAIIILRGMADTLQPWRDYFYRSYRPRALLFLIDPDAEDLPAALEEKQAQGEAVAYICQDMRCSAPITEFETFKSAIDKLSIS
jgi:hypothetical protein